MKDGITVVYTPEVSHLKLNGLPTIEEMRYVGDPEVKRLRETYQSVRRHYSDLPEKVGVITFCGIFKKHIREILDEIKQYPVFEGKDISGYPELDVLEEIMALGKMDINQPLAEFMIYRNVMLMAGCPLLTCDKSIESARPLLMGASVITDRDKMIKRIDEVLPVLRSKVSEEAQFQKTTESVEELREVINRTIPHWEDFNPVYELVKSRFAKNKVSRSMKLYPAPIGWFFPELYSVSLESGVDKPEYVDKIMPYLIAGAKASGLPEVPVSELAEINKFNKERFGRTTPFQSLETLLDNLPQKKVIFTDIPIVDAIPKFSELPFETIELNLSVEGESQ